jgi:hypothetical protein
MKSKYVIFLLLLALLGCTTESRRAAMEAVLDRAQQQNLDYDSITNVDSIALAAEFFDSHGTPNEQMRAHYLLGCAYRDMGEAPAALQCYQDAVDCADTLSSDCDYRRLMSVYGQMAELFHSQNLPTDEIKVTEEYGKYALLIGDTLLYIRNIELLVKPYFLLGDTAKMLTVLRLAHDLYEAHGFTREAASVYAPTIEILISRNQLDEASKLMKVFEEQSGLFDKNGNIVQRREMYYYIKGLYFLKRNELSKAEDYFRKISSSKKKDTYKGLLSVYRLRGNVDSIAKYAYLYETALDTLHNNVRTDAVHQMSSLYNYQRFLKKADSESRRAERMKYHFLLSVFFIVIVLFVAVVVGINLAHKRKIQAKETERLRLDYAEAVEKKDILGKEIEVLRANREQLMVSEQEARNRIETIKSNNRQLLEAKEKEIAELNEKIRKDAIRLLKSSKLEGDSPQFTLLLEDLHKKATRKKNISLPQKADWSQLVSLFSQTQPKAFAVIGRDQKLSTQELRACILLLMKFSNGEIISLLDISHQGMTNIRTRINEKLFGESSATTLPQKLTEIPIV